MKGVNRVVYDVTQQAAGHDRVGVILPVTIYGIKNCDTMKKARAWLDKRGVAYAFHDYKTAGIDRERLEALGGESGLGGSAQPSRHDIPQAARQGQGRLDSRRRRIALMLASSPR